MNLGLLDILTTQEIERPDFRKNESLSNLQSYPDDKKFQDYVENKPSDKNSSYSYSTDNDYSKDKNYNEEGNAIAAFADNNIGKLPLGISKEGLIDILKSLKSQGIDLNQIDLSDGTSFEQIVKQLQALANQGNLSINEVQQKISNLTTTAKVGQDFGDIIANNFVFLQEAESLETHVIPPQDIINNFGKAISNISNEVAQAGLQSSANIEESTLTNASIAQVAQNVIEPQTNTQSLSGISNIGEGKMAQAAQNVIETAKTNAQEPQILQSDVKSGQVESLLGKKDADANNSNIQQNNIDVATQNNIDVATQNNKSSDILKNMFADNMQNKEELVQKLQNQLDNQKVSTEKAGATSTQTQNASSQNNFSNNDSGSFRQASEYFVPSSVQSSVDTLVNTGEFTKFQKYVDTVSNNIKNMGAMKAAKADDVIAQIKFGVSSISSKGDSKITIQLHPKELGSVDVRMEVGSDGKAKVAIMAEKVDTLNLLQKEAGSLKGMLQDALQTQSSDLSFSFHEQSDEKWKEIIKEAFNSSYGQNDDEGEESNISSSQLYSQNMTVTDGLDIRV